MKKKIIAATLAAAVCLACVPLTSGCSAEAVYTLSVDDDGNKYYTVSYSGYASSLKGELVIPEYYGEGEDYAPVKEIADMGLAGTNLSKVVIPKTVEVIGKAAFAYDYVLTEVVFEDGIQIEEIPQGAFAYCELLRSIVVPDCVVSIGYMAFYNCTSLSSVVLGDEIEIIYAEAFEKCSVLSSINLPDTLTTIGALAFYSSGLTEIVIPDSVHDIEIPELDEDGQQKTNEDGEPLTSVMYGLGYGAFHTCTLLNKAVVGSGVTVLRSGVFGYCISLKEIYLSVNLQSVEGAYYVDGNIYYGHPFHNCTSLMDVYYSGTEQDWTSFLKNVDQSSDNQQGSNFDNSALMNAQIHYV